MVIVPVVTVSKVAGHALQVAMRLGGDVVPIAVDTDPDATRRLREQWKQWDPGVDLRVLPSPHRTLVAPAVSFVRTQIEQGRDVTVLLANVEPGAGVTGCCTTSAARSSRRRFAHAQTRSLPRWRYGSTDVTSNRTPTQLDRARQTRILSRAATHLSF